MERLEAGGERAAALSVYGDLAERLRRTLGVAPSAATRALAARLRVEERSSARVSMPVPSEIARAVDVPFVGRTVELTRLDGLLGVVAERRVRRLALLSGEPGIGKTRLALRFAAEPGRPATVLLGRCSEEPLTAYGPFAEIVAHCDDALGTSAVDELVGGSVSELDRLRGRAGAMAPDPGSARVSSARSTRSCARLPSRSC